MWIGIIVLVIALIVLWRLRKYKSPKVGSLALVTGGVKTGKSTMAVSLAVRNYKNALLWYRISCFFAKIFHKQPPEKPLLYSNVPLNVRWGYVQLTEELILRKERFAFKSVIYVNEASLLHDKDIYKDIDSSTRIALFNKLIGHSTHGGCIIYDTQCIGDLPVGVRRCLSNYFYIHHLVKWIPFFMVAYVREDRYSEDGSMTSVNTEDVESTLRKVVIPKRVWKYFDQYCWSVGTDKLHCNNEVVKAKSLKVNKYVTFQKFYKKLMNLEEVNDNEKTNNNSTC